MKNILLACVCGLGAILSNPAVAQNADAADVIAETLFPNEVLALSYVAVGGLMGAAMLGKFTEEGHTVSIEASSVVAQMMVDALVMEVGPEMRDVYADAYRQQYTPSELKDYLDFLETPSGRAIAAGNAAFRADVIERAKAIGPSVGASATERMLSNIADGAFPDGTGASVILEINKLYGVATAAE